MCTRVLLLVNYVYLGHSILLNSPYQYNIPNRLCNIDFFMEMLIAEMGGMTLICDGVIDFQNVGGHPSHYGT